MTEEEKKRIEEQTIIAAMIRDEEDGMEEVDCDECGSWDGRDRRCECGNRRCYWETTWQDGKCIAYPAVD